MVNKEILDKCYPKSVYDGTKIFYDYIRSHIKNDFIILNLGAGATSERDIKSLKGEVNLVYGADIDDIVLENSNLDIKVLIEDDKLPFEDDFFDLIWTDYVLEHIENPTKFLSESYRILKPGGIFLFRTPNKYHYVSISARIIPNSYHQLIANKLRGLPLDSHVHRTYYKANSKIDLLKLSKSVGFKTVDLKFIETEPSYLMFSILTFIIGLLYERIVNSSKYLEILRANILGKFVK